MKRGERHRLLLYFMLAQRNLAPPPPHTHTPTHTLFSPVQDDAGDPFVFHLLGADGIKPVTVGIDWLREAVSW